MKLSKQIVNWIAQEVKKAAKRGAVIGLSGGIDSAVTAVLAKKALGDNLLALVLPCENRPEDEAMALRFARKFKIKTQKIELTDIYKKFCKLYPNTFPLAKANLKPRLRMLTLYYFANTLDYLVIGTGNKSELMIGYFTKYGDGGCDILPLGDLFKTEVRRLAKELEIPPEIIKKAPTAGLWDGQTDEDEIGISYRDLDSCLRAIERGKVNTAKQHILLKIKTMISNSKHKRRGIPIFKKR